MVENITLENPEAPNERIERAASREIARRKRQLQIYAGFMSIPVLIIVVLISRGKSDVDAMQHFAREAVADQAAAPLGTLRSRLDDLQQSHIRTADELRATATSAKRMENTLNALSAPIRASAPASPAETKRIVTALSGIDSRLALLERGVVHNAPIQLPDVSALVESSRAQALQIERMEKSQQAIEAQLKELSRRLGDSEDIEKRLRRLERTTVRFDPRTDE